MEVDTGSELSGKDYWRYVSLSEFADIWSNIVLRSFKERNLNASEIFIRLMGLGAILKWRNSRQETPFFTPSPTLRKMRKYVPSLKINKKLADALNTDPDLQEKIRTIKPASITVTLTGVTRSISPHDLQKDENIPVFLRYVQDPNIFLWEIHLLDNQFEPMSETDYRRAREINKLLNRAAGIVVNVTRLEVSR